MGYWVIKEPGSSSEQTLELTPLGSEGSRIPQGVSTQKAAPRPVFLSPEGMLAVPKWRRRPKPRPTLLLMVSYLLGGMAPALLRQGRHRFLWSVAWVLSVGAWVAMFWQWPAVRDRLESGIVPLLPWFIGVAATTLVAFTAWSRAIRLTGGDIRFAPDRLSRAVRNPVAAGALGVVFPGLGLLVAGRAQRAAFAFWCGGPVLLAALALWRAGWLWRCNQLSAPGAIPSLALETVFLCACAVLVVGVLGWIATALDGARLVAKRYERASARADWLAVAVLVAIAAFAFTLGPSRLAHNLDGLAAGLRHDSYRLVPLVLEATAMRLDPSQPQYVMRTAELYDAVGRPAEARALREALRQRWEAYAEAQLRMDVEDGATMLPEPIELQTQK